eukprot:3792086-Prorocentrum_lima.AAC.1
MLRRSFGRSGSRTFRYQNQVVPIGFVPAAAPPMRRACQWVRPRSMACQQHPRQTVGPGSLLTN